MYVYVDISTYSQIYVSMYVYSFINLKIFSLYQNPYLGARYMITKDMQDLNTEN